MVLKRSARFDVEELLQDVVEQRFRWRLTSARSMREDSLQQEGVTCCSIEDYAMRLHSVGEDVVATICICVNMLRRNSNDVTQFCLGLIVGLNAENGRYSVLRSLQTRAAVVIEEKCDELLRLCRVESETVKVWDNRAVAQVC